MNRRFLLALAGAVFFGLLAIMAAKNYLSTRVNQEIAQTETQVVIAKTEIPRGTKIGPEHITVESYPKRLLPEGAMVKKDEVIGRVAYLDVTARTLILDKQLAGLGAQPGLSGITTPGMRSVSVRVDEASGVAGFVAPETYVDVIAIMQPQLDGAKPVSKVILQKVKVLAGGQKMETKSDGKAALVNTVTLEVTPAQAEKLKLAEAEGRLQLSIRNGIDQIIEKTPGATKRDVLNDIALENRAREGTRNGMGAPARAGQAPPPITFNVSPNQPATTIPTVKVVSREKSIELIEGSKRTRVEMVP
ncbi:MAG: Flp pilus assembly protein CpaB [Blastocatellales bacterium]